MTITASKKFKSITALLLPLALAACSSDDSSLSISTEMNGTWASYCTYNPASGRFETIDYELYNTNAAILLSSYTNNNCTFIADQTLYEGQVSQTGTVILSNGLTANQLVFNAYDQESRTGIEYTSYFYATSNSLYEYTNPNGNATFEFQRIQ